MIPIQILRDLKHLIERGVDGNFAIKTLTADSDICGIQEEKSWKLYRVVNIK